MILDVLNKFKGVKERTAGVASGIKQFFDVLGFILRCKERIDDDLDGDNKPELQNLVEEFEAVEADAVESFHRLLGKINAIIERAKKLGLHVVEK